ncbi:small redox-active disulfide protein 2 [Clostridium sp. USBA 49]|jgi:small redox-active disulfide protein 2|uniref:thioredoxin family protein n=2 Tax=Clostridium TaxID=1485 RepID=UPI00099A4784|nr:MULTISPECIES: thioredoxin family protein [Clostridium]SKA93052.1 small redox-active disulfide protein 2 [Clostridium sp. USBA 49]
MSLFNFKNKKEKIKSSCDFEKVYKLKTSKVDENESDSGVNSNSETMDFKEMIKKEGISVKILGSGCSKCNQLEEATKDALKKLGIDTAIEHVRDFAQIASYGVMTTPALVIDGKVVSYGKVLKTEEIIEILKKVIG